MVDNILGDNVLKLIAGSKSSHGGVSCHVVLDNTTAVAFIMQTITYK